MSMDKEKKAINKQAAADKAQLRANNWKLKAGIGDDDNGEAEATEVAQGLSNMNLTISDTTKWTQRMTLACLDPSGVPKTVEWTQVNTQAFEQLVKTVHQQGQHLGRLAQGVKKAGVKAKKWAAGIMDALQETSETLDRLKGYHDSLDSEVTAYQADTNGLLEYAVDAMTPIVTDINRLDTADTSYLVGASMLDGMGKLTQQTSTGRLMFKVAGLAMRMYAFTTATGSAFSSDEDAIPAERQTTSRGSGLLTWLLGRREAAANSAGPASGVEAG